MKRFLVTILAVVYIASSVGATVHMHYCMGAMFSIDFIKGKTDCNKCGMKSSNHCCNDQLKTVKLHNSHDFVTNNFNFSIPVAILNDTFSSVHSNISIVAPSFADVISNKPGKCPKCGMELTKVKTYSCSMHPEVISNKPGKCPKCNMELTEAKNKSQAKKD